MKFAMGAILVALLAGCASHTGIVAIGRDSYMIAQQQATGFPGLGNMKAEMISEGSRHCAAQEKEIQIISTSESRPPYVLGNYPRAEIQFMCLAAGDPALQRPQLVPESVLQIRK
jgi:hypothetical protein